MSKCVFTVSIADGDQRVRAIQPHASNVRELRICPVQPLVEIIDGQSCGRKRRRDPLSREIAPQSWKNPTVKRVKISLYVAGRPTCSNTLALYFHPPPLASFLFASHIHFDYSAIPSVLVSPQQSGAVLTLHFLNWQITSTFPPRTSDCIIIEHLGRAV